MHSLLLSLLLKEEGFRVRRMNDDIDARAKTQIMVCKSENKYCIARLCEKMDSSSNDVQGFEIHGLLLIILVTERVDRQ